MTCIFVLPFLVFIISPTRWWKRPPKNMHLFASIHGKGLWDILRKTHNQNIGISFQKIFKDGTKSYSTSINTIALSTCICSCRGVCLSSACIGPNILTAPLVETIVARRHFHPLVQVVFPPFVDDFSSTNRYCFG